MPSALVGELCSGQARDERCLAFTESGEGGVLAQLAATIVWPVRASAMPESATLTQVIDPVTRRTDAVWRAEQSGVRPR